MILIRADANEHIGAGHIMRCLTIAKAFAARGEALQFVTADHSADALIHCAGFENVCLNSRWQDMSDEDMGGVVREYRPKLVLVDSYSVTPAYFDRLSAEARVAYIDDLNSCTWNVDDLINYNIFASALDYSGYEKTRTRLLLGPVYAPLREEFRGIAERRIQPVTDIFVSAGGADPAGITESIIEHVCPDIPDATFHMVVGALNPRADSIVELAQRHGNVRLHINEQHMSLLMQRCDMAIAAAGATLYELCACGTPTITYTMADNQLLAAQTFDRKGIMVSAGDCRIDRRFIEHLALESNRLIKSADLRREMSGRMRETVDGKGADRLAAELLCG